MSIETDLAGMERELLLDADPGMLGVYADMLEDAGRGLDAAIVRAWLADDSEVAGDLAEAAAAARSTQRCARRAAGIAVACMLDATHPVEAAELRLSVAALAWPGPWGGGLDPVCSPPHSRLTWRVRRSLIEGRPLWTVRAAEYDPTFTWRANFLQTSQWHPDSGWLVIAQCGGDAEWRLDPAARAAAREWIALLLD